MCVCRQTTHCLKEYVLGMTYHTPFYQLKALHELYFFFKPIIGGESMSKCIQL